MQQRKLIEASSRDEENRVDIVPLLEHLFVDADKWDFLVNLARTYGVDLADYLSRPIEDEVENLRENPHFMVER